jgi:hypothetical protein
MSQDDSQRQLSGRYIDVPVREEFIPAVIELLADLERGGRGSQKSPDQPTPSDSPQFGQELVTRMYDESETRHRELLRFLAGRADEWIFTAELAAALGVASGSKGMAGMFGAFGRRAKHRYGGLKPWEDDWDSVRHEAKYRMTAQVADWVEQAERQGGG